MVPFLDSSAPTINIPFVKNISFGRVEELENSMKTPGGGTGEVLPDSVESMRFSLRSLFVLIQHHSGHLQNSPQETPVREGNISGHDGDVAVSLLTLLPSSSMTAAGPVGSIAFAEGPPMQFVRRPRVWYVRSSKQYGVHVSATNRPYLGKHSGTSDKCVIFRIPKEEG